MARQMKESGIEWIGQIPEGWKDIKLKYIYDIKKAKLPTVFYDDTSLIPYMSMDYIRGADITPQYAKDGDYCKKSDVLVLWDGSNAGEIILEHPEGYAPSTTAILSPQKEFNDRYMKYYLKFLETQLRKNRTGMGIPHVDGEFLKNAVVVLPLEDVQKKISSFLDEKIGEIDIIVSKTKASIEEYKKYKQSVVTEAVTNGLDNIVSMKDSGIEWIGKIPKEFKCAKLRHCVQKIGDVDHYMPETVAEGIPYVMTGDLEEKVSKICFDRCKMISEEAYTELAKKIVAQQGDVILARYATIGTVSYVDIDKKFIVSYSCVVIKPKKELNGKYLFYYSKSSAFEEELKKYTNSNTQGNVGIDSLYQAKIVLPSIDKQEEIVDYLDAKCAEIDVLIAKKEAFVEEMETYKKSLIYEYVTGKKEVL